MSKSFLRFIRAREPSELAYTGIFGTIFAFCSFSAGYFYWTHWRYALLSLLIALFCLSQFFREAAALLDQYLEEKKDLEQNGR